MDDSALWNKRINQRQKINFKLNYFKCMRNFRLSDDVKLNQLKLHLIKCVDILQFVQYNYLSITIKQKLIVNVVVLQQTCPL